MANRVWQDMVSALWGYEHALAHTIRDLFLRPRKVYEHYKAGGNQYFSPFRVLAVTAGLLFLLDQVLVDYGELLRGVEPPLYLEVLLPIRAQLFIVKVINKYQVLFQVLSIPIYCIGLHLFLPRRVYNRYTNSIVIITYAACMILMTKLVLLPLKYVSYTASGYTTYADILNISLSFGYYFGMTAAMLKLRTPRELGRAAVGYAVGWVLVWAVLFGLALLVTSKPIRSLFM